MTPKEKAKELFDKMYMVEDPMGNYPMCFDTAKLCTLTAVDEIINCDYFFKTLEDTKSFTDYWYKVQQEIEKI